MTKLTPNTVGWEAARLLLAGDVQVSGYDYADQDAITVTVAGSQIKLNSDQVNAVNMNNKEFPIQIVDIAYGAGKSVCASKMAKESAKLDHIILVTAVQNSASDVIGAKIDEMQSQHIRAVPYISETVAQNIKHQSPFALQSLMEKFHVSHGHLMPQALYKAFKQFKQFSDDRRQLRNFMFSGTAANIVNTEHKDF
uniref:ResIII domain-containing protein n=1 Tax=Haemonchus contortus TaxID=6289 RepID=A0A7I4XTT6_HAECO